MVNLREFNLWLAMWLVGLGLIAWGQRKGTTGVGLTLAYGLQMFVIHFLASAIYALPWYIAPSPSMLDGLKQSVYAIISFGIGARCWPPVHRTGQASAPREGWCWRTHGSSTRICSSESARTSSSRSFVRSRRSAPLSP